MTRFISLDPLRVVLSCVLMTALVLGASPIRAGDRSKDPSLLMRAEGIGVARAEHTVADGAAVRASLARLLADYEILGKAMNSQRTLEACDNGRQQLETMTDEELTTLASALPALSNWSESLGRFSALTVASMGSQQSRETSPGVEAATGGLDPAMYFADGFCAAISDPLTMQIAQGVFWVAEVARSIATRACDQTAAGFNGSVACIVTEIIYFVAKVVWEEITFCANQRTAAENTAGFLRAGHIHGDLELVSASVDSIFMHLKNAASKELRLKIEVNLAGHGSHPHAVAIFQLPAAYGGYLDTARVIVIETIAVMKSLGEQVGSAEKHLAHGEGEFAAGRYKRAYEFYGKAYREVTKPKGGDDHDS